MCNSVRLLTFQLQTVYPSHKERSISNSSVLCEVQSQEGNQELEEPNMNDGQISAE